jgi:hypothetical protein
MYKYSHYSNKSLRFFFDVRCDFAAASFRLSFLGVGGHTSGRSNSFSGVTGGKSSELTGKGTGRKFSDICFCGDVKCCTGRILLGVVGVRGVFTGLDFFGVV